MALGHARARPWPDERAQYGRPRPADGAEPGLRLADVVQQRRRDPGGIGVRSERLEDSPSSRDRLGSIGAPEAVPALELLGAKRSPDERLVGSVERPGAH